MKKILALLIAVVGLSITAQAQYTVSQTVQPGTFTNIVILRNGSARVLNVVATATTATNAVGLFVDTPTNALVYTTSPYTNTISYATNYVYTVTNYYGGVLTLTNLQLIDITNNLVAANTNSYPVRFGVGAAASTSTSYIGINSYFQDGIWVTNTGTGAMNVSVTVQQ